VVFVKTLWAHPVVLQSTAHRLRAQLRQVKPEVAALAKPEGFLSAGEPVAHVPASNVVLAWHQSLWGLLAVFSGCEVPSLIILLFEHA